MWILRQSDHREFLVRLAIIKKAEELHAEQEAAYLKTLAQILAKMFGG